MSAGEICKLWPVAEARPVASDADIVALYGQPANARSWMRANFVSSLDGAATHQGLSGGLSDDADHRVFDLLRTICDVVVVGAGTVRNEGYGAMRVDAPLERIRVAHGMSPQPVFALVSASLSLDPASPIFADAPVRPIVITVEDSSGELRDTLSRVADVIVCGKERVDTGLMREALVRRGLTRIHSEGGPHLFGDMIADATIDELCLTLTPTLEGGDSSRISAGAVTRDPLGMQLVHVLAAGDTLLLRYVRA